MSADEAAEGPATPEPAAPVLRVVNPDATPEEIAALVAVFSAIGGGEPAAVPPKSLWAAPTRQHRHVAARGMPHGRGAWRASGLPR